MTKFLNISTDTNLGGSSASDEVVSSQKALKTYIDAHSGGGGTGIDLVEINVSGKSWSKVYSNGWVEQGGYEEVSGSAGTKNVSLPKTMASTDYSIMTTDAQSAIGNGGSSIKSTTLAVDSFDFFWASKSLVGFYWEVKGMKASS